MHGLRADRRSRRRRRRANARWPLRRLGGTFSALSYREFRLLWIGYIFSNTAWWMQMFGLGWLAVELAQRDGDIDRAPLYIGLIGLSRAAPALAFSLIAGAIVDRSDRRRILLVTQAISALLTATLAWLTAAGLVNIALVMVLQTLIGTSSSFDAPARQSMLQRLVPPDKIMNAIGLQSVVVHGTGVLGPVLGGLLIGPIGVGGLLLANAIGYVPVMLAIALMAPMPAVAGASARGLLRSVQDGLGHIVRDPTLRWIFIVGIGASLFGRPYLNLLPAFVANGLRLGASELSLLLSATGVGAIAGALTVASLGAASRRGLIYLAAGVASGVLIMVLALQSSLSGTAIVAGLLGFTVLAYMTLSSTIVQTTAPPHLIGRVMAVHVTLWMGFMPLGQLLLGSIGSVIGIDRAFLLGGAVTAAVGLLALIPRAGIRSLRGADDPVARIAVAATAAAE